MVEKLNNGRGFAVDSGLGDALARENRGDDFVRLAVIEFFAVSGHVNAKLRAHKFIRSAQNIGELVFARISIIVTDFAGNGTISNRRRRNGISYVEFADVGAKKREVELVERLGKRKVVVVVYPDSVRGDDVAKFLVIFLFRHSQNFLFLDSFAIIFLGEIEELFGEGVVGNVKLLRRINLVIGHMHFLLVILERFDIIIELVN